VLSSDLRLEFIPTISLHTMGLSDHGFGDKRFGKQLFRDLKVDENGLKDAI
jgi:hypothetical protein